MGGTLTSVRITERQLADVRGAIDRLRPRGGQGDLIRQGLFAGGFATPQPEELCTCEKADTLKRWPHTCLTCGRYVP